MLRPRQEDICDEGGGDPAPGVLRSVRRCGFCAAAKFRLYEGGGLWDVPGMAKMKKNPAAVALGRLGGLKGGKARARKLTPKERSAIAKKAAGARWKKVKRGA